MRTRAEKMMWLSRVGSNPNISPMQFKISFFLVDRMNCKTQQCNPSVSTIANDAGCQTRIVQKTIKILESEHLLFVVRVRGGDKNKTNSFKFLVSAYTKAPTPVQSCTPVHRNTPVHTDALPLSPRTPRTLEENPLNPIVPLGIDQGAWKDLHQYRAEHRTKKVRDSWTELAQKKAAKLLSELSPEDQARCVDMTICNGWQGIFPEKLKNGSNIKPNGKQTAGQIHQGIYKEIAVAGSLDSGAVREDEVTLSELMDEEYRRREARH